MQFLALENYTQNIRSFLVENNNINQGKCLRTL